MPERVLQLLGPSAGGIRRHVALLTSELNARDWSVRVAGPPGVMDGIGQQDADVAIPNNLSAGAVLKARTSLARVAPHADLIHAHGLKAGLLASTTRMGKPLVATVHNLVLDEAAGRVARVLRHLESTLPRRVDKVIAVSQQIAERFSDVRGVAKVVVIAPVSRPPQVGRDRAAVREALGVAPDERLVVCAMRFHPQKDITSLVRAIDMIRERVPKLRAAIVGDGPEDAAIRSLVTELKLDDIVVMPGFSANAADELAAADVVASPSLWEGNPIMVGEALKLGRAVVATDVGDVATLIEDDVTGRLVPKQSPAALAEALADLLSDPERAAKLAEKGRARAESVLGVDTIVTQIEDVYRELLG